MTANPGTTNRTNLNAENGNLLNAIIADPSLLKTVLNEIYDYLDANWNDYNTHKTSAILGHPDGSVTTAKVADGAISTIKLADGSVVTAKIVDGSITSLKIANNAVGTVQLADGGVTTIKLADGNITSTKIGDSQVTLAKLASDAKDSANHTYYGNVPNKTTAKDAIDDLFNRLNSAIGTNSLSEVVDARTSASNGTTYNTLKTRLDTEFGNALSNLNATTVTLSRGQNLVTTNPSGASTVPFNVLNIKGRTLINLLGRDGNCEDVSKFPTLASVTVALDATNKLYGSNGYKVTLTSATGFAGRAFTFLANKYYVILADVKNGNASSGGRVGTANYGAGNFVTDTSNFNLSYMKLTRATDTSDFIITSVVGATGQYSYFDGMRVYEISQAEYNALGTTLTDISAIASKYPYVDDMKGLNNPYVNVYGQNLLPDFSQWSLNSKASITGSYQLTLNADATLEYTSYSVPCLPNTTYTISATTNSSNAIIFVKKADTNGSTYATLFGNGSSSITFTTDSTTNILWVEMTNNATGTFTFTNPMLNLGSTALPFVPRNDSPVYFQTALRSNMDQSIADTLTFENGQFVKTVRFGEVEL